LAKSDDWVFANPETGKPYWPGGRIQENWLVPAAEKASLGWIGWHTFRHSHSTLRHALGVDLKVQQELLRHADIRTTMNITPKRKRKASLSSLSHAVRMAIVDRKMHATQNGNALHRNFLHPCTRLYAAFQRLRRDTLPSDSRGL